MNHTLPPPDEWVGGEVSSNHYANDWEAGRRQKGQLARTSGWNSACLQCHHSAMMGYSSHYLMFGCRPRVLAKFYFPTFRCAEVPRRGTSTKCVDEYGATVWDKLRATPQEVQIQSTVEGMKMGMHPSMSSSLMTHHHLPWHGILPWNCRGTPAANIRVDLFPQLIHKEPQLNQTN